MVKKLLKHEFIYYIRTLGAFLPLILAISLAARLFRVFFTMTDGESSIIMLAVVSSTVMLYVGSFALIIFSVAVGVIRFYKNLYSAEGYLSFTLPVTNAQHIFVKLFASCVTSVVCGLMAYLAILIAELDADMIADLGALFLNFAIRFGEAPVHFVFYMLELLVLISVTLISTPLLYYACITIGQTAKKNRVLMAVAVYFIHYIIMQVLGTVVVINIVILSETRLFENIGIFIMEHPMATIHILLVIAILISLALSAIYYFVTLRFMSRKLNLE